MNKPSRLQIALYICLVSLMISLALREWDSYTVGYFLDDGMYVVLGESLSQASSYGWYILPEPLQMAHLPFGLPILLAPLTFFFPRHYELLRFVPLAASVLNVSLLFWGWRSLARNYSYWWGLALVALFALSPLTILFARVVMSEAPFLTWCLVAILLAERVASGATRWDAIWFGLSLVGVVYTRTIGWVIVGSLVLYLVIRLRVRAWAPLALAAVAFLVLLGVLVGATSLGPRDLYPNEYLQEIVDSVTPGTGANGSLPASQSNWNSPAPWTGILFHLDFLDWLPSRIEREIEPILQASGLAGFRLVPGILLVGLLFYGGFLWYRANGVTAFLIVAPVYMLALVFWGWDGSRFFYPIQPQLLFALMLSGFAIMNGAAHLVSDSARVRGLAVGSVLSVVLIGMLLLNLRSGTWFLPRETRGADNEWISQQTPPEAVLLTSRPTTYHMYVRRAFVPLPLDFQDRSDLVRQIRTFDVDYVIAPAFDNALTPFFKRGLGNRTRLLRLATELAERGVLVPRFTYTQGDAVIYEVDRARLALESE